MQRIQSITLRNFKFFYGTEDQQPLNKLELNQNNLLLYGENGSGKSSIYWALYTFMQSCLKTDQEISKYFDHANNQNLRNRFANPADDSGIILEIASPGGIITKEISNTQLQTNLPADKTVNRIIAGSDFVTYKYLSKLYDFRNSEEINLFDWLEKEVLMFIDFEEAYTDNAGNLSTSTLASDWWQFICDAPSSLPKNNRSNTPKQNSPEYIRYNQTTIPRFIELLQQFLSRIAVKGNAYLKDDFKEDFQIDFRVGTINCEFNKRISQRSRDGKLHRPKVPLKVIFDHSLLPPNQQNVEKPHTFLNEARLTAIALSIRLAMLDERLYDPNSASLLVLDDFLLSLDMSYRDIVLDIILKRTDEYQLLMLTHDRAFYNLCKRRIENLPPETFGWEFKEMYQDQTDTGIPCPFIPDKENYLSLTKKYLKEFDYPACANYLRKESERILKVILPKNLTIYFKEDEGSKPLQLDNLIGNLKTYLTQLGGDFSHFEKLKEHKDILMNPLSHDNIDTPIYKRELLNAIEIIEKLNQLKVEVFYADSNNERPFVLKETDTTGDEWEYVFYLKENFRAIKGLDGNWLLSNPKCYFDTRKNITQNLAEEDIKAELKLKAGYGNIRYKLGIKTEEADNEKDLKDIIFIGGTVLNDTL